MRTNAYSMSTRIRSLLSFAPILQVPRRYAFRSKVPCSPTRCSSTIRNVSVTAECCHPIYSITRSPSVDCAVDIAKRAAHNINSYLANTPVPEHTLVAFQHFLHWRSRPTATPTFILDACCGTGRSSFLLARLSGCDVVGVDKSVARLSRNRVFREGEVNADHTTLLLRGNMEHFWRLLYEHNIAPSQTFLLYPNPYPKSSQIKVRPVDRIIPVIKSLTHARIQHNTYVLNRSDGMHIPFFHCSFPFLDALRYELAGQLISKSFVQRTPPC